MCAGATGSRSDVREGRARNLAARPHLATFADADGVARDHPIIGATVEQILFYALYDPSARTAFLAALAAADRSDWVPLGRMAYPAGKRAFVPTASTFTYYATLCADFIADPASPDQDVEGYIRAGERDGLLDLRDGTTYLSAAPCLAWPRTAAAPSPTARLGMTPYPVFVLTAEDDPITTPASAERIAADLGDGYLITTTGGPHVTFGRGFDCPDDALAAFLVDGIRPSSRKLSCPGAVLTPYRPVPQPPRLERLDALGAMGAIVAEITLHPDVQTWDRFDQITTGCRFEGFMTLYERPGSVGLELHDCQVFDGATVTGTGQFHDDGFHLAGGPLPGCRSHIRGGRSGCASSRRDVPRFRRRRDRLGRAGGREGDHVLERQRAVVQRPPDDRATATDGADRGDVTQRGDAGRRDDRRATEGDKLLVEPQVRPAEQAVAIDRGDLEGRDADLDEATDGLDGVQAGRIRASRGRRRDRRGRRWRPRSGPRRAPSTSRPTNAGSRERGRPDDDARGSRLECRRRRRPRRAGRPRPRRERAPPPRRRWPGRPRRAPAPRRARRRGRRRGASAPRRPRSHARPRRGRR